MGMVVVVPAVVLVRVGCVRVLPCPSWGEGAM